MGDDGAPNGGSPFQSLYSRTLMQCGPGDNCPPASRQPHPCPAGYECSGGQETGKEKKCTKGTYCELGTGATGIQAIGDHLGEVLRHLGQGAELVFGQWLTIEASHQCVGPALEVVPSLAGDTEERGNDLNRYREVEIADQVGVAALGCDKQIVDSAW